MVSKFKRVFFALTVMTSLAAACTTSSTGEPVTSAPEAATPVGTSAPKEPLLTPTATTFDYAACEERLAWVLMRYESDLFSHDSLNDVYQLVTYDIENNQLRNPEYGFASDALIPYQEDAARHQQIWDFASSMMTPSQLHQMDSYLVYTDGEGDSLGAVRILDTMSWMLAVDIRDAENIDSLSITLVHEIAHLISLENDEIVINPNLIRNSDDDELYQRAKDDCDTYFTYYGCSKPDSYMNTFFQQFWPDVYEEWQEVEAAETWSEYYSALENFYDAHEDQFVSSYSVTNPMEDLAESFTHFVFEPRPSGNTIADQKVLFFYGYGKLLDQRQDMLRTLCTQTP